MRPAAERIDGSRLWMSADRAGLAVAPSVDTGSIASTARRRGQTMDETAIRQFIDSLDGPEAFTGPPTAVDERLSRLVGAAEDGDLLEWQSAALEALTVKVLAEPAAPLAAALVHSGRTCRVFEQECCEELGWFVARVRRELADVARPWLAVMAPDATPQGVAFARYEILNRPPARPVRRLAYYTETRSPGLASAMVGAVHVDGQQAQIRSPEPVRPSDAGLLGRVLRGHPDRRRHRLPARRRTG